MGVSENSGRRLLFCNFSLVPSLPAPAAHPRPPRKASAGADGDSDESEEWDPTAAEEDLPALDTAGLSSALASLRLHQMKPGQLSEEDRDMILSLAEVAAEIVGCKVVGDAKPAVPPALTQVAEAFVPPARVESQVQTPAAAPAPAPAPTTTPPKVAFAQTDADCSAAGSVSAKERTQSQPPPATVSLEKAPTAFRHFLEARTVSDIEEGFRYLLQCVQLQQAESGATPAAKELPYASFRKLPEMPWKATQVWKLLDAQLGKDDHAAKPLQGKSVVVVGAGPVGLRMALQLALVGTSVTVLEKRGEFVRINRLHLWDWVKQVLLKRAG
eukprot:s3039_g5.t1